MDPRTDTLLITGINPQKVAVTFAGPTIIQAAPSRQRHQVAQTGNPLLHNVVSGIERQRARLCSPNIRYISTWIQWECVRRFNGRSNGRQCIPR